MSEDPMKKPLIPPPKIYADDDDESNHTEVSGDEQAIRACREIFKKKNFL